MISLEAVLRTAFQVIPLILHCMHVWRVANWEVAAKDPWSLAVKLYRVQSFLETVEQKIQIQMAPCTEHEWKETILPNYLKEGCYFSSLRTY